MKRRKKKSISTRMKLCDSYLALMRSSKNTRITVKDITSYAGYDRATFYLYFSSIYVLQREVKRDCIAKIKKQIRLVLAESNNFSEEYFLREMVKIIVDNEKYLVPFLIKDPDFPNDIKRVARPLMRKYFNLDFSQPEVEYMLEYHLSSLTGVIARWVERRKDLSFEKLLELIRNIVTRGVFTVIMDTKRHFES